MGLLARSRNFIRERLADPREFDRRSFRTVKTDAHRVTIGCPKGQWDPGAKGPTGEPGLCLVGTKAQTILHPASEAGKLTARHGHKIVRDATH